MKRDFHIGDVLTVTTGGTLLSPRHMEGVYDILNYLTADQLFTHQIPRAIRECQPHVLRQHPQLAEVDASTVTPENHGAWLNEQIARFGETLPLEPLPDHAHEFIDPMSELAEKIHPDQIIAIGTPHA